jgi:hypothetical protein
MFLPFLVIVNCVMPSAVCVAIYIVVVVVHHWQIYKQLSLVITLVSGTRPKIQTVSVL